MQKQQVIKRSTSILYANNVLVKTYILLASTLLFSAITAAIALVTNTPPLNPLITIIGYFVLLYVTMALRNNPVGGIVAVFAFTGFLGFTLGGIINLYLTMLPNGHQVVMTALAGTGIIFLTLSGYALSSKKNFSYLGGALTIGVTIAFLIGIATLFIHIPILDLAVSAMFTLLSSGIILYKTSQIIHGGERNYIVATVTLYVAIFNLFLSLLRLLGAFSNRN